MSGHRAAGKIFKVHLDCHNLWPYLMNDTKVCPCEEFFYYSDTGLMVGAL